MILSDFHVHTKYCDGRDTVDEISQKAVSEGMISLGFSSHEYTSVDTSYCMSRKNTEKYITEVLSAKEKYRNSLEIYLGTERDLFSDSSDISYDYVIGSVHYIKAFGKYIDVDLSADDMQKNVSELFGGDYFKYARAYFESLCTLAETREFDIVGHFDLLTKFNEGYRYFNEDTAKYKILSCEAAEAVARHCGVFELNTGAISRGYRTSPYPSTFILKTLKELGVKIILSSDSHCADTLRYRFDEAAELLKALGYKSVVELKNGKFTETEI